MTGEADGVDVTRVGEAERPLIEGLFQFYAYDFSELEPPGSPAFEPEADGRFAAYAPMESYWREPSRIPLVIRRDGRPVGFALINALSHSGLPVERNMAEFFVMRKHRRGGVARAAVQSILSRHPGLWEIAVAERNTVARAFWPGAIAATPGVRDLTTLAGDGVRWTGPIHRFNVDSGHGSR
jgi:predicted acetyltransferase